MLSYWERRRDARYYAAVRERLVELAPASVLDVGTGPTLYCNDWPVPAITAFDITVPPCWRQLGRHVRRVVGPSLDAVVIPPHEGVTCLQTLEHVAAAERSAFVAALFAHATAWVLITVPFRWTKSRFPNHVGIDEEVLTGWVDGRVADEREVIREPAGTERLLALYRIPPA